MSAAFPQGVRVARSDVGHPKWRPAVTSWFPRLNSAKRPLLGALGIFVLALVLRLTWVFIADVTWSYDSIYESPPVDYTEFPGLPDVVYYAQTAKSIAEGEGFAEPFQEAPSSRYGPGWPAVLSIFYLLFGSNVIPALVFNATIGALTCLVTYLLGMRLFGWRAGLWAGILLALFPVHIILSPLLLTEVLYTFILVSILLLATLGMRGWRVLLLGLLTGAATLIRGEAAFLPLVFYLILLLQGQSWRAALRPVAIVAAAMMLVLAPWVVRNSLQFDSPVLLTTQGGRSLFIGHAEGADGYPDYQAYFEAVEPYKELPEPRRQLEINRALSSQAREGFLSDPLGDLALVPTKLRGLFQHDPIWRQTVGVDPLPSRPTAIVAEAYYYFVVAGFILTLATRPVATWRGAYGLIFGVVALWSFVFGFLFFGIPRYHIPLLPILTIAAAAQQFGRRR